MRAGIVGAARTEPSLQAGGEESGSRSGLVGWWPDTAGRVPAWGCKVRANRTHPRPLRASASAQCGDIVPASPRGLSPCEGATSSQRSAQGARARSGPGACPLAGPPEVPGEPVGDRDADPATEGAAAPVGPRPRGHRGP